MGTVALQVQVDSRWAYCHRVSLQIDPIFCRGEGAWVEPDMGM